MKTITRDQYLQALALFTMATEHARKGREFEEALARLFGKERHEIDGFSDAIYGGPQYAHPFDELLKREGFILEEPLP
jgi:hypothetical protein